jgi:hypothetical protein
MKKIRRSLMKSCLVGVLITGLLLVLQTPISRASHRAQIPTGSIPTVTSSPMAAMVTVLDNEQGQAFVRAGPHAVYFDVIGVLVPGQQVAGIGVSQGGEWVQIAYPGVPGGKGWIYRYLVDINGTLPIVESPPTPAPQITATIDPTLAAQFLVEIPATRLPTYTAPAPLVLPTLPTEALAAAPGRIPIGLLIVGMFVLGLFGTLLSFLRGR